MKRKAFAVLGLFVFLLLSSCVKQYVNDPVVTSQKSEDKQRTPSTKPITSNALAGLAGNEFNSYQISHRVDLPIGFAKSTNPQPAVAR